MADENLENGNTNGTDENSFIEEAKKLEELKKKNEELEKQNKDLLKAKQDYYDKVLQVEPEEPQEEEEENFDLKGFTENFFKDIQTTNNLDFAKGVLKINEERKKQGLPSGFLPVSSEESATPKEEQLYDYGGKLETLLKKCVEEANDDPHAFNIACARYIKGFKI